VQRAALDEWHGMGGACGGGQRADVVVVGVTTR